MPHTSTSSGTPLHTCVVVVDVAVAVVAVRVVDVAVTVVFVAVVVVKLTVVVDDSVLVEVTVVVDVRVVVVADVVVVVDVVSMHESHKMGHCRFSTRPTIALLQSVCFIEAHMAESDLPLHKFGVSAASPSSSSSCPSPFPESSKRSSSPDPNNSVFSHCPQSAGHAPFNVLPSNAELHCSAVKARHSSSSASPSQFICVVVLVSVAVVSVAVDVEVVVVDVVGVVVAVLVAVETRSTFRRLTSSFVDALPPSMPRSDNPRQRSPPFLDLYW